MLSCLIVLSHNIKLVSIIMLHLYCDLIIMVAFLTYWSVVTDYINILFTYHTGGDLVNI